MRNITLLLLFLASFAQAQVSMSASKLDFGQVLTTSQNELAVSVTNTSSTTVIIDDLSVFNSDFSYSVPNATIAPGATVKVRVTFEPKHNLRYNSELIFILDNGSEHRIDLVGDGKYEGTYYAGTFNKTHQELKDALKTILASGYINLGYTGCRDKMYSDIDNDGGKVTCVYTGRQATFSSRSGANSNSFNCEHTWPQSKFNKQEPERADIHHLFPTDANSNSRRGSYPFGTVSSASWSEGGSKLGGGTFEPRDEQKGATARAMLYFALRYQDYGNFIDNQESILKQWHVDNPPTAWDIQRNNKIYSYQKNRNPFVDHPEFIERMNKIGSTDTKPVIKELKLSQSIKNFKGIDGTSERTIYLINTGNTALSGISNVSSENGNITVKSVEASAESGEVSKIILGFKDLADGVYSDNLTIDVTSQVGKKIVVPVTFTVGVNSVDDKVAKKISVRFDRESQTISLFNVPNEVESIAIYGQAGQQILLNDISETFTDIPFYGHSQGAYFVVVKTKSEVYTSRFLVY
ncbi:MAG: endonuclease [Bacteroidia bacterium]